MTRILYQCEVCEKPYESLKLAETCEEAHAFSEKKQVEEDSFPTRRTCGSVRSSSGVDTSDGNWHSSQPDANGWYSSSTPSYDR